MYVFAGPIRLPTGILGAFLIAALAVSCEEASYGGLDSVELESVSQSLAPGVIARLTGERDATTIIVADKPTPEGAITGSFIESGMTYAILENELDNNVPNIRHAPLGRMLHPPLYSEAPVRSCLSGHGACLFFGGYKTNPLVCLPNSCAGGNGASIMDKPSWGNDRLEVILARDDARVAFGTKWYLRFYIYLDPDFVTPAPSQSGEFIVHQVWQQGPINPPAGGPPFAVYVTERCSDSVLDPAKAALSFRYRNNRNAPPGMNGGTEFLCTTVNKGTWYNFHIMAQPWANGMQGGPGAILIWKNVGSSGALIDSDALNYSGNASTYRFNWGYAPADGFKNTFDVRVGIKRSKPMTNTPMLFDSIKLTVSTAAMNGI